MVYTPFSIVQEKKMKDVTISDRFTKMTLRMCERHFRMYRARLDKAMEGGTSYSFIPTNKRGCDICKKEKE